MRRAGGLERIAGATIVAAIALLASTSAGAQQDYPSKPIRIIVPSIAGGGTDSSTRIVVSKLGELLGQRNDGQNRGATITPPPANVYNGHPMTSELRRNTPRGNRGCRGAPKTYPTI